MTSGEKIRRASLVILLSVCRGVTQLRHVAARTSSTLVDSSLCYRLDRQPIPRCCLPNFTNSTDPYTIDHKWYVDGATLAPGDDRSECRIGTAIPEGRSCALACAPGFEATRRGAGFACRGKGALQTLVLDSPQCSRKLSTAAQFSLVESLLTVNGKHAICVRASSLCRTAGQAYTELDRDGCRPSFAQCSVCTWVRTAEPRFLYVCDKQNSGDKAWTLDTLGIQVGDPLHAKAVQRDATCGERSSVRMQS